MTVRRAPFAATEEAVALLHETLRDYQRTYRVTPGTPRLGRGTRVLVAHDARLVSAQAAYMRLVGIAEAYTDVTIEALYGREFPQRRTVLAAMVERALADADRRWSDRTDALQLHGIPMSFRLWSSLLAAVEVRNAIAHGLGALTRRQRSDGKKVLAKLKDLKIPMDGTKLLLDVDHVEHCKVLCVEYVRWLDAECKL